MAREQAQTMMAVAETEALGAARWRVSQRTWSSSRAAVPMAPGDCPKWAVCPVAKAFHALVGSYSRTPQIAWVESGVVA